MHTLREGTSFIRLGRHAKIMAVGLIVVVGLTGTLLLRQELRHKDLQVPPNIAQQVPFHIYIPQKLPGSYQIDNHSFAVNDNILVFKATDGLGGTIAITEQAKPKNFNFDQFYRDHFSETQVLSNVPYPSVSGTDDENHAKPLSIVTSDVWIVINSQAALDDADLHTIAQSIKRY